MDEFSPRYETSVSGIQLMKVQKRMPTRMLALMFFIMSTTIMPPVTMPSQVVALRITEPEHA